MPLDGFMKKYNTFAIVIGGLLGISILVISFNLLNTPSNGNDPFIPDQGIGFRIASKMEATQDNISYVWIYNNTFANVNLSTYYGQFIDGVGIGIVDNALKMVLVHEPTADIENISQQDLNNVMVNFRDAISNVEEPSETFTDIGQLLPTSFICDIAYEDGTSLSLVFSNEHKVLGVVNGTWTLSGHTHHGLPLVSLSHNLNDSTYLDFPDANAMISAIESFEGLVHQAFPL